MVSLSPSDVQYQKAHIDDEISAEIIVACAVCLTAAYSAVFLRFVSRRTSKTSLEADDYFIVTALVGSACQPLSDLYDWICRLYAD